MLIGAINLQIQCIIYYMLIYMRYI